MQWFEFKSLARVCLAQFSVLLIRAKLSLMHIHFTARDKGSQSVKGQSWGTDLGNKHCQKNENETFLICGQTVQPTALRFYNIMPIFVVIKLYCFGYGMLHIVEIKAKRCKFGVPRLAYKQGQRCKTKRQDFSDCTFEYWPTYMYF